MQLLISKSRFSLQNTILFLALLCATVVTIAAGTHVSAATATAVPQVASGLEISPASVELNGQKGKTYDIQLKVHNVTTGALLYSPSVDDFTAKDETGTPKLLAPGDLPPTASMISWVAPLQSFTLQGGEIRQINITLDIPENAEAGGHYGVINFISSNPTTTGNAVGVRASTGLLILATVAGNIKEDLNVSTLTTEQNGKQKSFFENGPITFVTRLQNTGNVHLKPSGTIEVRDMFGGITGVVKVNEALGNVLPNSIRRFESTLNKNWMFGRYDASLTVGYGTTGQVVTQDITFWVIPYKIVLVVLLVLITLIFIIRRIIKVNNKRVIKNYKKHNGSKT